MEKRKAEQAKKHLEKLRQIIAENPSPIFNMSKEEVIKTLRETRESIWKEKLAVRH